MSVAAPKLITADELFEMGDVGRCELIRGQIVTLAPAGFDHGGVASEIDSQIRVFVTRYRGTDALADEPTLPGFALDLAEVFAAD